MCNGLSVCSTEDQIPHGFPSIDMGPQLKVVERTRTATMLCAASGNPDPEIFWFKDFLPVEIDSGNGRIKQLRSGKVSFWTVPALSLGSPLFQLSHLARPSQRRRATERNQICVNVEEKDCRVTNPSKHCENIIKSYYFSQWNLKFVMTWIWKFSF